MKMPYSSAPVISAPSASPRETSQASFALRGRNPDVLTCIANLSNDEVFTPPEFASRMLDTLAEAWAANHGGANLWADKTVTFLDPCTKSGVFLREITSRLTKWLEQEIPNLAMRVNRILLAGWRQGLCLRLIHVRPEGIQVQQELGTVVGRVFVGFVAAAEIQARRRVA
jgi:hypothetical protein